MRQKRSSLNAELSASDTVRSILSYLWSLLTISAEYGSMHHLGFLILDEPRQQELKEESFRTFFQIANHAREIGRQVIVFTSEDKENLINIMKELEGASVTYVDGKVLQIMEDDGQEEPAPTEEAVDELLWDMTARQSVGKALDGADWDYANGEITIYHDTGEVLITCKSYEELQEFLESLANEAGSALLPTDDEIILGFDPESIVAEEMEKREDKLKQLGWT